MVSGMKLLLPLFATVLALVSPLSTAAERDEVFTGTIETLFPKLVETRRHLHANPELSNEEEKTAAYVAQRLTELGLEVRTGVAGHGIVALLKGKKEGACADHHRWHSWHRIRKH